jgi:hypothetical protein
MLTDDNNFNKNEMNAILNESVNFFTENNDFSQELFEEQVLKGDDTLKDLFHEHEETFLKNYGIQKVDNFQISSTAVSENKKYLKSKIKLDNNFVIEVHSGHDLVEEGYDEAKKMKFKKIYYTNED